MGEIIVRKVRGMNWKAKIALVLMFTLVFSTFMHQGLWKPKKAEAALSSKQGTFVKNTAAGAQSITGLGFQPKAIIFYWTKQTTAAYAASTSSGYGFAAAGAPITMAAVSVQALDAQATTDANNYHSNAAAIVLQNTASGGAVNNLGTVTAFGADGFTVSWSAAGQADIIHYIALGGTDITNAKVGTTSMFALAGASSVTGVGFQPDTAFLISSANGITLNTITASSRPGRTFGFMSDTSGAMTQGSVSYGNRDARTATGYMGSVWSNTGYENLRGTATDVDATWTSWDIDGFTMNAAAAPNGAHFVSWLALKGGLFKLGTLAQRTSAGTQAITGIGFQPNAVLFASANLSTASGTVSTTAGTAGKQSFGAAAATQSGTWIGTAGTINSDENMYASTTAAITHATSQTTNAQASLSSLDADGFTLNWTAADATARNVLYIAMGTAVPAGDSVNIADGTDPANYNAGRGSTNNVSDSFTMVSTNTVDGAAAVTGVTASFTNSANITGVRLYKDVNANGTYEAGTDTLLSTGTPGASVTFTGFTENLTTAATNYLILVDISGTATLSQTIDTVVTAVTVTAPDAQGTISDASNPTRLTIVDVPHENVGTALNTAIATSPQMEGRAGVLMQRFQVTSATSAGGAQDNQLELNSLGLVDLGTATGARTAKVYIDNTSSGTLPGTAALIGSTSAWTGGATTITLNQGTAGDRTVTNATARYIYIVYDLPTGLAQTVQSSVTSVGAVSPDAGQTGLTLNSNALTLSSDPSKITTCAGCHAYPPADGTRSGATGAVKGSHSVHSGNVCATCHVAPATETSADFAHRDGNIKMQPTATGIKNGYYDKNNNAAYNVGTDDTFLQTNNPTQSVCRNVGCHGGASSVTPTWGGGVAVNCSACHTGATDASDGAPTRRAIFGEFQNNAIGHMQYNVAAGANATVKADCSKCHAEPLASHVDNTLDNGRTGAPGGATITQPPVAAFCLDCHKAGATNNSFSTQSRTSPNIDGSGWTTGTTAKSGTGSVIGMQSHRVAAAGGCTDCHGDGAGNARVHGGTANNLMKQSTQYATCFNGTSTACHGSSSTIVNTGARIQLAASATGGMHPIFGSAVTPKSATLRRATMGTTTGTDGGDDLLIRGWLPSSTMVCSDCHSQNGGVRGPHGSAYTYILKGYDNTAVTTATSGRTLGTPYASGLLTLDANNQQNICLNCHAADVYGDGNGGTIANSAFSDAGHTTSWTNTGTGSCGGSANAGTKTALINCLNCHAGSNPAGGYGAHGSSRAPAAAGVQFGGSVSDITRGAGLINGDSWTAAPDATGCYATAVTTSWSACTKDIHN